ncbi:ABC transporter substrate-binding protein [Marinivivus vitaminiproducens]|uniref:ABC transporter substrate-binding protein n=1 Tax=Marinivivus vitaminiproducens TaxID=3035935 RepID=UPI0027AB1385|nr:ABC transporter substrate-binding protein [Geminicoccaceae bacterium SCSIO 64248]
MPFVSRLAALAALLCVASPALGQQATATPPREETLIVENPEGATRNPGWFNVWALNAGGQQNGIQQLSLDTLWFIDPEKGLDGAWDNSLASERPIYSDDFTEMTVKLRDGIFWSDGVAFTADDVVYTVQAQIDTPGMRWSALLARQVEEVSAPDPQTVHFRLKAPNARFHSLFTARFNAVWIMPKHVFEPAGDPSKFAFNPPVSLGPYTLRSFDPQGNWYSWEKRPDWQRTAIARYGEPAPNYVTYVNAGPPDKRVLAQLNHDLDMIHDVPPEGMFTLLEQSKTSRGWFPKFPYAHPDPTLPSAIFNMQKPMFQNRDVRWALTLLLDMRQISMAAYRGAATISPIAIPPTGTHPDDYHFPLEAWLTDFELDTGDGTIKPYDPNFTRQIVDMVRPQMGDAVPTDPQEIKRSFGIGWWKKDEDAAEALLEKAGFSKSFGGSWYTPDDEPFTIRLLVEGDTRPVLTRAGSMIVQQWRQAGIDVKLEVAAQSTLNDRRGAGDFDVLVAWSVETYGGHPDLSYFLDSWHSDFVAEPGAIQSPRNWQRWQSPELDALVEKVRTLPFDDPRVVEVGQDYAKLMVREMPIIPLMAYNVFTAMDDTYWTGYPTAENPYTNPVTNWGNTRYMMVRLKPASAAN